MAKWKLVVGVFLVFAAGMLVGSFGTGYGLRYFFDRFKHDSKYRIDFVLGRMTRRLDLTEIQREKVKTILTRADKQLNQYWTSVLTEAESRVNLVKGEIKKELNPEQIDRFNKLSRNINSDDKKEATFLFPPGRAKQTP